MSGARRTGVSSGRSTNHPKNVRKLRLTWQLRFHCRFHCCRIRLPCTGRNSSCKSPGALFNDTAMRLPGAATPPPGQLKACSFKLLLLQHIVASSFKATLLDENGESDHRSGEQIRVQVRRGSIRARSWCEDSTDQTDRPADGRHAVPCHNAGHRDYSRRPVPNHAGICCDLMHSIPVASTGGVTGLRCLTPRDKPATPQTLPLSFQPTAALPRGRGSHSCRRTSGHWRQATISCAIGLSSYREQGHRGAKVCLARCRDGREPFSDPRRFTSKQRSPPA